MIRITNQEEFKKCCEMCDSKDLESRLLGLSLMNECVEFWNTGNISVLVWPPSTLNGKYDWYSFLNIGINDINYKFGTMLHSLLLNRRFYEVNRGATYYLIENDQNN
jgi:hypothetical protein